MIDKWGSDMTTIQIQKQIQLIVDDLFVHGLIDIMGRYNMGITLQSGLIQEIHGLVNFTDISSY